MSQCSGPYTCDFPGQHEFNPGGRWRCPWCGTVYRLTRPIRKRFWRNWYAPLGRWKVAR